MSQPQSQSPPPVLHLLALLRSCQLIYPSDLLSAPSASLDQILADISILSFEGHTVAAAPSPVRKQTAKENG